MTGPARSRNGFSKKLLVTVIIVLTVVGVVGAMFAGGYLQSFLNPNNPGQNQLSITGNYLAKTYTISRNSTVDVACSYCNITLEAANRGITISLDVTGNSNEIVLLGGRSNIDVRGNDNVIDATQTSVVNMVNTGRGNIVQKIVPIPAYLDRCVARNLLYHAHLNLTIAINGTQFIVPSGVGIQGTCLRPIHTHDSSGTIHIETDSDRDYTLADFFLVWGHWENNPQRAIFNSTQIFDAHAVNGHTLTMTVNGSQDSSFQNYVIPRNAATTSAPCSSYPCQTLNIVITYA